MLLCVAAAETIVWGYIMMPPLLERWLKAYVYVYACIYIYIHTEFRV